VLALAEAGAAEVAVINRTAARGEEAASLAGAQGRVAGRREVPEFDLVINATSVGMEGQVGPPWPIDPELLRPRQILVDLIYSPLETPLMKAAQARGVRTFGGLGMLAHQAARAFTLWTGEPAPVEAMLKAVSARLS